MILKSQQLCVESIEFLSETMTLLRGGIEIAFTHPHSYANDYEFPCSHNCPQFSQDMFLSTIDVSIQSQLSNQFVNFQIDLKFSLKTDQCNINFARQFVQQLVIKISVTIFSNFSRINVEKNCQSQELSSLKV